MNVFVYRKSKFMKYLILIIIPLFSLSSVFADAIESFEKRLKEEKEIGRATYGFSTHKPNYVLPITYNQTPNQLAFNGTGGEVQNLETKFQFSFKFNLIESFYKERASIKFGYTAQSFWQVFNKGFSAPFRETNHEPEVFITFKTKYDDYMFLKNYFIIGLVHQSNGKTAPESRSWNRIYFQNLFQIKNTLYTLKVWHRFKETKKDEPTDFIGDDNPDILNYTGYFELRAVHKINENTFSVMVRNNLKKENKGAVEASWSFPFNNNVKFYFQYFNGYNESLVDYNHSSSRLGFGFVLGDWL